MRAWRLLAKRSVMTSVSGGAPWGLNAADLLQNILRVPHYHHYIRHVSQCQTIQEEPHCSNNDKVIPPGDPCSVHDTHYLEAYNLMEENADMIFEPENMLKERSYDGEAVPEDSSLPMPASMIPGPRAWPIVGCLPYMLGHKAFDPQRVYLFWEAVRQEFGPTFRKDMPGHSCLVFISRPEDLESLFRSTMYDPVRPGMTSLKKIRSEGGADGHTHIHDTIFRGRAGILAEQGEEWWRVRRRVQRPLTDATIIHSYLPQMDQVAMEFVERIRYLRDEKDEMPESFNTELHKWALESLGTITLERRLGCLQEDASTLPSRPLRLVVLVKQLLGALHHTENLKLWQYFPTTSIKRLQEAHQVFTDVALEAIRDTERLLATRGRSASSSVTASSCPLHHHQKGDETSSFLETLLRIPGLSREDVLTFLLDMIFTGIDTTSHAVGNMLYLLARNPQEQQKVQQEIDKMVGRPRHLTPDHLAALTYTKAVFRETLRMMPVSIGIVRRLNRDTILGGYRIPAGWEVVAPTLLMNQQEAVFPRAGEFLPERFLRGSSLAPRHHFSFLPFSYGPRMCIGRRIAYQEIFCLIVRILSELNVDYKYEDIHLINRLSYGPSHPLRFTFTDRMKP
ncbi:hypothetical protein OTU49_010263 [Cherax quadricarinatus]|uniref:Cytochrome P450 n=2 Tax=Cherax quadricarinatus TaxID=27406 RepID=A0AAW0W8K8_CHEQU